ncbi:MAG: hypothetical protein IPN34_06215 [Planctomycetes bacterium]|nr:hypothetical protein [Planctomycetota bacterium]
MPDSLVLRTLLGCACLALAAPPLAAQELPELRVGGNAVPTVLLQREALRLFAGAAMEDLAARLELEQLAHSLARLGVSSPASSIDAPLGTQQWIDALAIPARVEDFLPLERLGCGDTAYAQALSQLRQRFARLAQGDPEVRPISDIERGVVRGLLQRSVLRDPTERWAWCELAPSTALVAGGASMDVAEAWQRCAARLGELPDDASAGPAPSNAIDPVERRRRAIRLAAEWTGAVTALSQDLASRGALLSEAEWRRFATETLGRGVTRDANLSLQVLPGLGMPSVAAFGTYAWLRESYSRGVIGEFGRAQAEATIEETNAERLTGKIDLEVLLFAAYDFAHSYPLPELRAAARERAAACAQRLAAGEPFDQLFEELSEYQDLRLRTRLFTGENALAKTRRGRFGELSPQALRLMLGSTPFDLMTGGVDLARAALHELPVGAVSGPLECTFGVCFVRVKSRSLGAPPINFSRESELALARETLLTLRFERWIGEVLARAGIEIR